MKRHSTSHPSSARPGCLVPNEELFLWDHEDDKEWFSHMCQPRLQSVQKIRQRNATEESVYRILELEVDSKHMWTTPRVRDRTCAPEEAMPANRDPQRAVQCWRRELRLLGDWSNVLMDPEVTSKPYSCVSLPMHCQGSAL